MCFDLALTFDKKMMTSLNTGYNVTLSYLPNFGAKEDYLHYYTMINTLSPLNNQGNMLEQNKISIKLQQLGETYEIQEQRFFNILQYANQQNVFVWISAVTIDDTEREIALYYKGREYGYIGIGITIATYHSQASHRIDKLLKARAHIRLVKGYYYGDLSNDWKGVGDSFELNAQKLIQSGYYHCIATHDFPLLSSLHKTNPSLSQSPIEFGFFYSSKSYIEYQLTNYGLSLPHKSLYIPYGCLFPYIEDNIMLVDIRRIISRAIMNILYLIIIKLKQILSIP
jgi:hypothetical protein